MSAQLDFSGHYNIVILTYCASDIDVQNTTQ